MSKIFNVTGNCRPEIHYMVDIKERLAEIKKMVDKGDYFTINRARQYGKTTTLRALSRYLENEYLVISMDFQKEMSDAKFRSENAFSVAFAKAFLWKIREFAFEITKQVQGAVDNLEEAVQSNREELELVELFRYLSDVCRYSPKPIVLMIDEVDSATNNQVFLDFLAQLRGYYIDRDESPTFHSVILAGVYDVKNIRRKIRANEEHKINSPWNISVEFPIDMSFSAKEIAGMLNEYEEDYATGMDVSAMAELLFDYTSGYPFLVSRICKLLDETIAGSDAFPDRKSAWTKEGFLEAVKMLLSEKNTLFESLVNKLADYPELHAMLYTLLFTGKGIPYNPMTKFIETAEMFGFIKNIHGNVAISNRIFETVLYNLFLSEEVLDSKVYEAGQQDKNQFIQNGHLNMDLVLEKFVMHFDDLYGDQNEKFYEDEGRRYFLLYLKPIINGTGNYYIESRTRNMERTDVIVDYHGEQFVIELKVWRGNAYNTRGEKQLMDYLNYYHLNKGYMLSFNFNKKKQVGVNHINLNDKLLVEAVV